MFSKIFANIMLKSIARDVVVTAVKKGHQNDSVVKEKLGVSTIDEFMKMDVKKFNKEP